jgi:hypothetical protein
MIRFGTRASSRLTLHLRIKFSEANRQYVIPIPKRNFETYLYASYFSSILHPVAGAAYLPTLDNDNITTLGYQAYYAAQGYIVCIFWKERKPLIQPPLLYL